jgi:hypothetical protein
LIHLAHSPSAQVVGDFVVVELCSDHDEAKESERILTEPLQITADFGSGSV